MPTHKHIDQMGLAQFGIRFLEKLQTVFASVSSLVNYLLKSEIPTEPIITDTEFDEIFD